MHVPLIINPLKALQNDVSNLNITGWNRNQLSLKHLICPLKRQFSFQAKTFKVCNVCAKSYTSEVCAESTNRPFTVGQKFQIFQKTIGH